jgi:hypothetical protein
MGSPICTGVYSATAHALRTRASAADSAAYDFLKMLVNESFADYL